MDVSQQAILQERLADLTYILTYKIEPKLHRAYVDYGKKWKLFGGPIPQVSDVEFTAKGTVKKYELLPPDNTRSLGVVGPDDPVAEGDTQSAFTNICLTTQHITDIENTVSYDDRMAELVKQGDAGMAQAAALLAKQAVKGMMGKMDMWTMLNRQSIIGQLAADTLSSGATSTYATWAASPYTYAYDDTTNSRFVFYLAFLADAFVPGILKGRTLQAAATPSSYFNSTGFSSPIVTLRNWQAPMRVIGHPQVGYHAATTSWWRVLVAVPYTAATKAAVQVQVLAITATDVIGPWPGASTGTTDIIAGGFNYGLLGLRWSTETDGAGGAGAVGSGAFADVEDAGGAISSSNPLKTFEETQRSVDRNAASGEWGVLNPLVIEGAAQAAVAAMTTAHLGYIDTAWMNQEFRSDSESVGGMILVNHLIHSKMRSLLGVANFRTVETISDAMAKRFGKYGVSGFVYQGESSSPILVGKHPAIPADMVLGIRDGANPFEHLMPRDRAHWRPGAIAGIWNNRRNSSGQILHSLQATRRMSVQQFPRERLDDRLWVIRAITPGT